MASLIERLVGDQVVRTDQKRIMPVRRPLPERPRDVLDMFSAMGGEASMSILTQSLDIKAATPGWMIAVVLNRWPTLAELQALPSPYEPRRHMAELVTGVEFRSLLAQRILTAYPEKRRMLFVRVPQCAGKHFLHLAQTMHPIFPDRLANPRPGTPPDFFPTLGLHLGKYPHMRSIMLVQPCMAPFYKPVVHPASSAGNADPAERKLLPWTMGSPAYRPSDRLFTIVRDPEEIILGQVNSIASKLRAGSEEPSLRGWRKRLQPMLESAEPDWQAAARQILAQFSHANPICTALGDGTLAGALEACAVTAVEIADLGRYDEWITRTWDTKAEPPEEAAPAPLARENLLPDDLARLATLTEQDRPLYTRIKAAIATSALSSVTGAQI